MATLPDDKKKPDDASSSSDLLRRLQNAAGHDVVGNTRRMLKDANRTQQDVRDGLHVLGVIGRAGMWCLKVVGKAASFVPGPARKAAHFYMDHIWHPFTWKKDKEGDPYFSKRRAGVVVALTAVFAAAVGVHIAAIPDLALYELDHKTERIMLHMPNEPGGKYYTVDGAWEYPATPENTVHFRIENSSFNELWSLYTKHEPFFPDRIKSAVPPVPSWCTVEVYGFRAKIFANLGNTYPYLLDVKCDPVGYDSSGGGTTLSGQHIPAEQGGKIPQQTAPAPAQTPSPVRTLMPPSAAPVFNQGSGAADQPKAPAQTTQPATPPTAGHTLTPPAAGQTVTPQPARTPGGP